MRKPRVKRAPAIRPAVPADRAALVAMMRELWPDEPVSRYPRTLAALRRYVCDGPHSALFVAEGDGALRGFVGVGVRPWSECGTSAPIPHVEGWFVARGWRRRGVGRALLRAAEDWARGQGFTEIGSDTWAHNARSIAAHLAAGYRVTERIVYLGKRLSPRRGASRR